MISLNLIYSVKVIPKEKGKSDREDLSKIEGKTEIGGLFGKVWDRGSLRVETKLARHQVNVLSDGILGKTQGVVVAGGAGNCGLDIVKCTC